jgi:hypothetical protein
MICTQISNLIGIACHPLNEDGSIAMIDTAFAFDDGDGIPVYLEKIGGQVRFFDDGETILHFYGRGVKIDSAKKTRFIKNIAATNGVTLTDMGVLEIWAPESQAPSAFASYMSAMVGLTGWEKDQTGLSTDISLLITEVAQCLHAWKPNAQLTEDPEYIGISGESYKLDFDFNGEAVIAISPHHSAVGAAVKKLLDIKSAPKNSGLKVLVVIDDRYDSKAAKKEGLIMDALATVWPMTRLEKQAGMAGQLH